MKKVKSILFAVAMLGLGIFLLNTGWREYQESKAIAGRGIQAEGTVTDGSTRRRKARRTYKLTVEFKTAKDQAVREEKEVGSKIYEGASVGERVPVFYLEEKPEVFSVGVKDDIHYANLGWGALLFLVGAAALFLGQKQPDIKELSAKIAKQIDNLCDSKQNYAAVNAAGFGHLDLGFYDQTQTRLEQVGFVKLGDFEDRALDLGSMKPIFLRLMAGENRTTSAAIFHLKPLPVVPGLRVVEFETEFADGTIVGTNNMAGNNPFQNPPGIDVLKLPYETAMEEVLNRHRQRVQSHQAARPGVAPVILDSAAAAIASQARQKQVKAAYRRGVGVTDAEFKVLLKDVPDELVPEIHAEVMRLHREKYPV